MFRLAPMLRLSLLVLERDERAVLQHLGTAGIMHIMRTPASPDTAPLASHDRSLEMGQRDRLLARAENLCRSLELKSLSEGTVTMPGWSLDLAEKELDSLEARAGDLLRRRQSLKQQGDELSSVCKVMSAYRGLQIPLSNPDQYSFLHFVAGRLPEGNMEKLDVGDHVALLPLSARNGWQPVVLMTTPQRWLALKGVLQKAGFQKQSLPVV